MFCKVFFACFLTLLVSSVGVAHAVERSSDADKAQEVRPKDSSRLTVTTEETGVVDQLVNIWDKLIGNENKAVKTTTKSVLEEDEVQPMTEYSESSELNDRMRSELKGNRILAIRKANDIAEFINKAGFERIKDVARGRVRRSVIHPADSENARCKVRSYDGSWLILKVDIGNNKHKRNPYAWTETDRVAIKGRRDFSTLKPTPGGSNEIETTTEDTGFVAKVGKLWHKIIGTRDVDDQQENTLKGETLVSMGHDPGANGDVKRNGPIREAISLVRNLVERNDENAGSDDRDVGSSVEEDVESTTAVEVLEDNSGTDSVVTEGDNNYDESSIYRKRSSEDLGLHKLENRESNNTSDKVIKNERNVLEKIEKESKKTVESKLDKGRQESVSERSEEIIKNSIFQPDRTSHHEVTEVLSSLDSMATSFQMNDLLLPVSTSSSSGSTSTMPITVKFDKIPQKSIASPGEREMYIKIVDMVLNSLKKNILKEEKELEIPVDDTGAVNNTNDSTTGGNRENRRITEALLEEGQVVTKCVTTSKVPLVEHNHQEKAQKSQKLKHNLNKRSFVET